MTSPGGTGRWSERAREVHPFGMSFVDIVASALICVVALLILWLQFIDPLGYVPGKRKAGAAASGQQGAAKDGKSGPATLGLQTTLFAVWDADSAGQLEVKVECSSSERNETLTPNADNIASLSFRFSTVHDARGCTIVAAKGDRFAGAATVHARVIVEGKQFYQLALAITADSGEVVRPLISSDASRAVWVALGEPPRKSWAFQWSVLP